MLFTLNIADIPGFERWVSSRVLLLEQELFTRVLVEFALFNL